MPWFSWWRRPAEPSPDPTPVPPFATVLRLGAAFEALPQDPRRFMDRNGRLLPYRIEDTAEGAALLAGPVDEQRRVLREAIAFVNSGAAAPRGVSGGVSEVIATLLQRPLPWDHAELLLIVRWVAHGPRPYPTSGPWVINALQRFLATEPLTPELRREVGQLIAAIQAQNPGVSARRVIHTLRDLIGDMAFVMPLKAGDAWADAAITDIGALDPPAQQTWNHLLHLCGEANSSAPTLKWRKAVQPIVAALGETQVRAMLVRWFPLVDTPRAEAGPPEERWMTSHVLSMYTINSDVLRGLVWLCAERADPAVARVLGALAVSCQRKIPGEGPRLPRITNACIWALGEMPSQDGLAQLAILKIRLRSGSAQRVIERALTAAANHAGLSPAEVEELLVPTYGLNDVGVRAETIGAFTAEVQVVGTTNVMLSWRKADGKRLASVPQAIKDEYGEELAELAGAVKDIKKMLPVQRDRIEHLYLERATWPFAVWQERYLDHPLVGTLARRMIWRFHQGEHSASGVWHEGRMVRADNTAIPWIEDDTTVELWHPLHEKPEAVQAWRAWLTAHEVQQPFKQAHREVYVVTDAEQRTRLYSNRFAAHILRQHQFNALAGARRWKNSLRLGVDDEYGPAERRLAAWGLRAEFWIEGINQPGGHDFTDSGTYLYLTTDQVRFYPLDAPQHSAHASGGGYHLYLRNGATAVDPVPQAEVPALVFSEIMRDVDLFVGVAGIGNDPTWVDGGNERPHQQYWASYAFGDLAETAKMRREVLEGIVPRLKISARCEMAERFLVVRGDIRTYKIHLGSGNILMQPNDQYLCIVPGRGEPEAGSTPVFLPFEGDRTLAIILSKALLLANDTAIKDQTILRQITSRRG